MPARERPLIGMHAHVLLIIPQARALLLADLAVIGARLDLPAVELEVALLVHAPHVVAHVGLVAVALAVDAERTLEVLVVVPRHVHGEFALCDERLKRKGGERLEV